MEYIECADVRINTVDALQKKHKIEYALTVSMYASTQLMYSKRGIRLHMEYIDCVNVRINTVDVFRKKQIIFIG